MAIPLFKGHSTIQVPRRLFLPATHRPNSTHESRVVASAVVTQTLADWAIWEVLGLKKPLWDLMAITDLEVLTVWQLRCYPLDILDPQVKRAEGVVRATKRREVPLLCFRCHPFASPLVPFSLLSGRPENGNWVPAPHPPPPLQGGSFCCLKHSLQKSF